MVNIARDFNPGKNQSDAPEGRCVPEMRLNKTYIPSGAESCWFI
ncbi:hypothetical protein QUF80_23540 [Desulfococcaceae bacterium HSG8]|nr:hypothetical protein [Desulfococcaceae bacterium HSG8]